MEILARSFIKELDVMKNKQRGSLKVQDEIHTCWEVNKSGLGSDSEKRNDPFGNFGHTPLL